MEKAKKTNSTKLIRIVLAITATVLLALILLFLVRGWLRMTLVPNVIEMLQGNLAQKTHQDEARKLQDPLTLLGYQDAMPNINDSGCHTTVAKGLKTQVTCGHNYDLGLDIPPDPEAKQALITNTEKLQALLQANGWQGEYSNDGDYTSLVKLVTSLNSGIDYQPDATYQKKIGDVECIFSNTTAFSSPAAPKMSTRFYCSRTFNIFGEPSWN